MKKMFVALSTVILSTAMYAQVGINTDTPTATLDIQTKENTNATKALKINNSSSTEIVTVTNGGRVGIGAVVPNGPLHVSTTESNGIISERANATNPSSPPYLTFRRNKSASSSINGAVATNDVLGAVIFSGNTGNGYEGDAYNSNSAIVSTATENFSTTTQGSELRFMTVPNGTAGPSIPRMTIANAGNVGIGTTTPQKTLHVNGSLQLTNELNLGGNSTTSGSAGTNGQVLTSNGPNTAPSWRNAPTIDPNNYSLTKVYSTTFPLNQASDTNRNILLGSLMNVVVNKPDNFIVYQMQIPTSILNTQTSIAYRFRLDLDGSPAEETPFTTVSNNSFTSSTNINTYSFYVNQASVGSHNFNLYGLRMNSTGTNASTLPLYFNGSAPSSVIVEKKGFALVYVYEKN